LRVIQLYEKQSVNIYQSNEPDPRMIAVGFSLLSGSTIERRALSAGSHAVLEKPFGPADLLQLLCRLLSR
jgi:CheY-like chemotaxis protein